MEQHALLILASGKASRFGGFPKAFCKINNKYIAQYTVDMAKSVYSDIYLTLNTEIFSEYCEKIRDCHVNAIETGLGDAHSLLRALSKLKESNTKVKYVTVCWGDTVFYDTMVFEIAMKLMYKFCNNVGFVICADDEKPYAWFETNNEVIVKSHFADRDIVINKGLHDQSIFVFCVDPIIDQLEKYKNFMGITEDIKYSSQIEMKLLDSFSYFYENQMEPMRYIKIEAGLTRSFNTIEEFNEIKNHCSKR